MLRGSSEKGRALWWGNVLVLGHIVHYRAHPQSKSLKGLERHLRHVIFPRVYPKRAWVATSAIPTCMLSLLIALIGPSAPLSVLPPRSPPARFPALTSKNIASESESEFLPNEQSSTVHQ